MYKKILVQDSKIHGRGVFARCVLEAGERIIEYKGERIDWKEAQQRSPHNPKQPHHTFFFSLEQQVIDGRIKGNAARWINHACDPNCEAREIADKHGVKRIFIFARERIQVDQELFYDYGLVLDGRKTKKLREAFACYCGSKNCRGTMLA